jgi:hypothetical protein
METTLKTKLASSSILMKTQKGSLFLSNLFNDAEKNRFGVIPILIVIIACIGGIAAAFGAGNNTFKLGLVIFPTIIALALTLAVAPMHSILWVSALALVLDFMVFFI